MKTLDEKLDVAVENLVEAAYAYGKDVREAETVLRSARVLSHLMTQLAGENDDLVLPEGKE